MVRFFHKARRVVKHQARRAKSRFRSDSGRSTILEALEPKQMLAGDPIISEFQAINSTTLADEDGDFEDWIEIHNTDSQTFNIGGWFLTDDAANLEKWRIPDGTTIDGSGEILVFASNKDRSNGPLGQLHTNFKLSGNGEYLGLVRPDGTVADDYNPYRTQFEDQSYGIATGSQGYSFLDGASSLSYVVPSDDSLGNTWKNTDFDDSLWDTGVQAVGYEQLAEAYTVSETFDAPLGPEWTIDIPAGSRSTVTVSNGTMRMNVQSGDDADFRDRDTAPLVYRELPTENVVNFELIAKVRQRSSDRGRAGIVIYDADNNVPAVMFEYSSGTSFRLEAGGRRQESDTEPGLTSYYLKLNREGPAWHAYFRVTENDDWTFVGSAVDGNNSTPYIFNPRVGLIARSTSSSNSIRATFDDFDINVPAQQPIYGPSISTDVGDAMLGSNNSSIYIRIPFDVDVNPEQLDDLEIRTRFDDGFAVFINGVAVTTAPGEPLQANTPINAEWNSQATAEFGAIGSQIPVRSFDISSTLSALQQGENVLAIHGMNYSAFPEISRNDSDFLFSAELFGAETLEESEQFFATPTPGAANELPLAPEPVIVEPDRLFFGSQTVTIELSEPLPGIELRYTTDGSDPTVDSFLYTGPLQIGSSAMLQVRAFDPSMTPKYAPSNPVSATFIAASNSMRDVTSNLPIMVLDGFGGLAGAGGNSLTPVNVALFDISKATGLAALDSTEVNIEYVGRGGARDRGSSTSGQSKPNMTFETWGKTGTNKNDDEGVNFLGLGSDADWVLHAPFSFDRAKIRNQLAFELTNQIGDWAANYRHVEVYLDGVRGAGDGVITSEDYVGVYALLEKIEQDGTRLDIAETDATTEFEDGGFIWKVDRSDPDAPAFSAGGQGLNWVYPKSPNSSTARDDQKATMEQQNAVVAYFNDFAATLANPDINDPEGYSKYIDPVSWVDQHFINVYMMNVDAMRLSAYMFKDAGKRIEYGPPWDFDRSSESADDRDDNPLVWRSQSGDRGTDFFGNGTQRFWGDLFRDPGFWQLYIDRWQMWRDTILSDTHVNSVVDAMADEIREAAARDIQRWTSTRPRSSSGYKNNALDGTYQGELENLKTWLAERANFMDHNFAQQAEVVVDGHILATASGSVVSPGAEVTIRPPALPVFVDEVLLDGTKGATQGTYKVIGDNSLGATWAAPDFDDSDWASGPLGFGDGSSRFLDEAVSTVVHPDDVISDSTTMLVRVKFDVSDLESTQNANLILQMKYDDGFVAYLNGQEMLRENLRSEPLAWNSRAASRGTTSAALELTDFDISEFSNLLVEGTNTLAIRVINTSSGSNDILVLPQIVKREIPLVVNPQAKAYYTTDGTDPRGPDGNPSPSAIEFMGGGTITLQENTRIVVRNFDDTFDRGPESAIVLTDWSGPRQYDLTLSSGAGLEISEINYNPVGPSEAEESAGFGGDDFEFIELHNTTGTAINLLGVRLTDGVEYDFFDSGSLAAGERAVVVANQAAFEMRYGEGVRILGQYAGNLNNDGERVRLKNGVGDTLFSVGYGDNDPWPVAAGGLGATLELVSSGTPSDRQTKWYSWQSSFENGGTPGTAGVGSTGVVINEVLARTENPITLSDSIELHNASNAAVDVSGWFLSDSLDNLFAYEIPAGTVIPAGGYVVLDEDDFNADADDEGFALNGTNGESVYLVQGTKDATADQGGNVTGFADDIHFGGTTNGTTLGRVPNGSGRLAPLASQTLGFANTNPLVGPLVVITEIQYNPTPSAAALAADPTLEDSDLEFIEIHNPTVASIDLTDWRVRGGIDYNFADGATLAAGEFLVLLKFDPTDPENINQLNAFRAHYGIDESVRLEGGYAGQLNNSDDRVTLMRPDLASPPNDRPRVQADEVLYDDLAPWPTNADGTSDGFSLQRVNANAFGNDSASWFGAPGTPGELLASIPGDLDGNGVVDPDDINALFVQMRSADPDLSFDLTGDGLVNAADRDRLVEEILSIPYGDANYDGVFNSEDFVAVFISGQYEDNLALNSTWQTGDWDGNGEFDTEDIVLSFIKGAYQATASTASAPTATASPLVAAALQTTDALTVESQEVAITQVADEVLHSRPLLEAANNVDSLFADDTDLGSDVGADSDDLANALTEDGLEKA